VKTQEETRAFSVWLFLTVLTSQKPPFGASFLSSFVDGIGLYGQTSENLGASLCS
jgi:hypothetical protein